MKKLLVLLLCFGLVGCATIYKPIPYEKKQHTYIATFDKSWAAIIEVISEENLPIATIDKTSGIILTSFVTTGMWGITKKDSILEPEARFTLNILVKSIDANTTRITINSHIERWVYNGWVDISNRDTILQDKYFKKLDEKLKI